MALYPHDASKRLWCENRASWPRHTFIEHLKLIYPQITNVADKTFLVMIKDLKFEFDLDDINVDTRFLSELRKKSLVSDIFDLRVYALQMIDESMSRPRRPILTPQTFRSVVGIQGNELVLKNAFVRVSKNPY